jgi:hypothetical protein
MTKPSSYRPFTLRSQLLYALALVSCAASICQWSDHLVAAGAPPATRRVNVPLIGEGAPFAPAIFWLGKVGMADNYADVRVIHYDSGITFYVHVADRVLWQDPAPSASRLTEWDAVSVCLDLAGRGGTAPSTTSYCFVKQLGNDGSGSSKTALRGNGTGWVTSPASFSAVTAWRGVGPNDDTWDMGWTAELQIPFSSLGLSSPPSSGVLWGLAVAVHDRDAAVSTAIADQVWPEGMQKARPDTWGELRFGLPTYTPPTSVVSGTTTVRHGLNGATVPDAAVGGHTVCGEGMNAWTEWGNANYAGLTQFNIQNQWDIADFMCFSKYFVTFPLSAVPAGKSIVSARVRLSLFGNAGYTPDDARPSAIDVLTVEDDWLESTITWNNAPYAKENVAVTWVNPVRLTPAGPYEWDVSYAVAQAYAAGRPLRLAFYSTDGDYHSGKYFWSSDVEDWNASGRPALEVNWSAAAAPSPPANVRIIK